MTNDPATAPTHAAELNLSVDLPADLEARVQRLEETVAALQDTHDLEERIVERVTERLQHEAPRTQSVTAQAPQPAPRFALAAASSTPPDPGTRWLLVDMVASARLLVRMLCDRRFHLAWNTHLIVWTCLAAIALSGWWFPPAYLFAVGTYFEKAVDLLLAFCIYKALSRELRRYRALFPER